MVVSAAHVGEIGILGKGHGGGMRVMPGERLIPFGEDLLNGSGISYGVLRGLLRAQARSRDKRKNQSHRCDYRSQTRTRRNPPGLRHFTLPLAALSGEPF
jgi:hypothetical protein